MPRQGDMQRLLSILLAAGAYKLQGRVFLICLGLNFVPESGGIFPAKIQRGHINCLNLAVLYAPSKNIDPVGAYKTSDMPSFIRPAGKIKLRGAYKLSNMLAFICPGGEITYKLNGFLCRKKRVGHIIQL